MLRIAPGIFGIPSYGDPEAISQVEKDPEVPRPIWFVKPGKGLIQQKPTC